MTSQKLIYALCCPFTNSIHYVGKSTQGLIRPMTHLTKSHSVKIQEWVEDLKVINNSPKIRVLAYLSETDDIDEQERYFIQRELKKGSYLLNSILISPMLISQNFKNILVENMDNSHLAIGHFIQEKRRQTGLTQSEFASKCGIALTVIRKIEQGKTNLNFDALLLILKMFGCKLQVARIQTS